MKKLALMAAVAAIALAPAVVDAKNYSSASTTVHTTSPSSDYTVVDRDMDGKTMSYTTTTTSRHKQVDAEGNPDFTGKYSLIDGSILKVEGKSAMLTTADMSGGFYAPNSAYVTQRGQTFFVEDGQILRLKNPPEVVAIDADDIIGSDNDRRKRARY